MLPRESDLSRKASTPRVFLVITAILAVVFGGMFTSSPYAHSSADTATSQDSVQARLDTILSQQPGATQINRNEVTWTMPDGTEVLYGVPDTLSAAPGCPSSEICFYADRDWQGEYQFFRSCSSGTDYWLSARMRDQVSSWRNNISRTAWAYNYRAAPRPRERLWTMNGPGERDHYVGDRVNDKMDYYRC